jgi:hypothetical protein
MPYTAQPPLIECLDGVAYMVDPSGRILSYGQQRWNSFAAANDAPKLCEPQNIIDLSLLDVVQGDDVKDIYRRIMDELLEGKRDGFAFGFRCDGPSTMREMRMAITPVRIQSEVTGILFQSILLRSNHRPPLDIFRFRDSAAALDCTSDRQIVTLCSYCQKIRVSAEHGSELEWISAEDYYRRGGSSEVQISHGICQECHSKFWEGE